MLEQRHSLNRSMSSSGSRIFLILCLLIFGTISTDADSDRCNHGNIAPGRTWPSDDMILEYGQPLRIYCTLTETLTDTRYCGKRSTDLVFFQNEREVGREFITLVNESTIAMYVEKPEPSVDTYHCKLRLSDGYYKSYAPVSQTKVTIGFKPLEPTHFECVSQNWENLTCTWDPAPNYIATSFSLAYELPGKTGGRMLFDCPVNHDQSPNTCTWDPSTDPPYRIVYEFYKFILYEENVLGSKLYVYHIHHWANVIPAKPVGLSVVNKTSSSVLLHWEVPYPMGTFPPGLHHKVSYQSEWDDPKKWKTEYIKTGVRDNEKYFNLSDLQYANAVYNVRVFSKSSLADGENRWSQFSEISFKTLATLPSKTPQIDIGSFEVIRDKNKIVLYIYWQTIPSYMENGDQFRYEAVSVEKNGQVLALKPQEVTETYAKFTAISLYAEYKFEIAAINCQGSREQKAEINVPSLSKRPRPPKAVTRITFDDSLYGLWWKPVNSIDIVDQTIFWCENDSDRPDQCTGYLDWVHVGPNTSEYNVTVPNPKKTYRFAIAANARGASSGMSWHSYSVSYDKLIAKIDGLWGSYRELSLIEIEFTMRYLIGANSIEGFRIYYCPVSEADYNCNGLEMISTVLGDVNTTRVVLTGLSPDTTYNVSVAPFSTNGEGLRSDWGIFSTLRLTPITMESRNECTMKQSEAKEAQKRAVNAQRHAASAQQEAVRSIERLAEACDRKIYQVSIFNNAKA